MYSIRSVYVAAFACMTLALSLKAIMQLASSIGPALPWIGLLLAAAAPTAYLARRYFFQPPPGAAQRVAVGAACGFGVAVAMVASWRFGQRAGSAHLWSFACLLAWFVYTRWICPLQR